MVTILEDAIGGKFKTQCRTCGCIWVYEYPQDITRIVDRGELYTVCPQCNNYIPHNKSSRYGLKRINTSIYPYKTYPIVKTEVITRGILFWKTKDILEIDSMGNKWLNGKKVSC